MAKKNKPNWLYFLLAAVLLAIAYGFASLAIDKGSFWQYVLTIVFLVWAIKEIKRGVHGLIRK